MDIWAIQYDGKYGLRFLTERARRWVQSEATELACPEGSTLWISEEDFIALEVGLLDSGLQLLVSGEERGN